MYNTKLYQLQIRVHYILRRISLNHAIVLILQVLPRLRDDDSSVGPRRSTYMYACVYYFNLLIKEFLLPVAKVGQRNLKLRQGRVYGSFTCP